MHLTPLICLLLDAKGAAPTIPFVHTHTLPLWEVGSVTLDNNALSANFEIGDINVLYLRAVWASRLRSI